MAIPPLPRIRSPQVKRIRVIVPFSRPEHFERTLRNFRRQSFPDKELILVENNSAIGTTKRRGITGVTVLESRPHQSAAKNMGLEFVRQKGGGFCTIFDDDDWYGPDYLSELAGHAKTATVLGKHWHFVSLGEGLPEPKPQLLLCNTATPDRETTWLTGGTVSGFAEDALEYPESYTKDGEPGSAEDIYYCLRMQRRGATIRCLSAYHYLYRRVYASARHTWKDSREQFLARVKPAMPYELPLADGDLIDLDLVSGKKSISIYRRLGEEQFRPVRAVPESAI